MLYLGLCWQQQQQVLWTRRPDASPAIICSSYCEILRLRFGQSAIHYNYNTENWFFYSTLWKPSMIFVISCGGFATFANHQLPLLYTDLHWSVFLSCWSHNIKLLATAALGQSRKKEPNRSLFLILLCRRFERLDWIERVSVDSQVTPTRPEPQTNQSHIHLPHTGTRRKQRKTVEWIDRGF